MHKIVLLLLLSGASVQAVQAQQKTARHLLVTIYETFGFGGRTDLIETHDDGTPQTIRKLRQPVISTEKSFVAAEDSVMTLLKPYFDSGWEITASTEIVLSSSYEYIQRFFLRKEE